MKILADYNLDELKSELKEIVDKPFRVGQIYSALNLGASISNMTAVSKQLREKLLSVYVDEPCKIVKRLCSSDGTEKYLFKLYDGNIIEGVLMKYKYGYTQCVSTQVGCRMGCAFCASTIDGLKRNLSAGEILSEVLVVNALIKKENGISERGITNIVLMGSGEPLDNYDNTVKFLRLVSSSDGLNVSPRNISLSTCGLVNKIDELSEEGLPINLTISLHSPIDEIRLKMMPVTAKYSVQEVVNAARRYFENTKRRVYFEYSMVRGVNDSIACADSLCELVKGFPCHVNLIRLNDVKESELIGSSQEAINSFMDRLETRGVSVTLRRSNGADIEGACGQLRRKYVGDANAD